MPYPIERKLVIAVSSSALFDLSESHAVFEEKGPNAYKEFQEKNLDKTLDKGVAFPFIKRFLNLKDLEKRQNILIGKDPRLALFWLLYLPRVSFGISPISSDG